LKNLPSKDRFREMAVVVLTEESGLTSMLLRERVIALAESEGRAIKSLSSIGHRTVHSVLSHDKQRRFEKLDTKPLTWKLVINE